ncbi:uncharacterized protein LOC143863778 isoform X2 [Tasmannia lanceolata]|uniref:uncharacterized protein LOC143863778 isoform X2 n=1 Tax=Tasmannia lanceolata TaxID=3420 RepID=UPI004064B02B
MRIRKRPLVPFLSKPLITPNPSSTQNPSQLEPKREDKEENDQQGAKEKEGLLCTEESKGCCMLPIQIPQQDLEEGERWSARNKGSRRNGNVNPLGAETSRLPFSSQVTGRWHKGETAFTLKKRKGRYEWGGGAEEKMVEKEKKKMKLKRKRAKKKSIDDDDEEDMECGSKKREKSSNVGALMEGSRCSRVNGRGWRCCKHTLVGYSLCEHHLGKVRLRSINVEEVEKDDDILIITMKKKSKKIGIVKARSISSLMGQTNHTRTITTPTDITSSSNLIV